MKTQKDATNGKNDRQAVEANMEKATEREPGEFRDKANEEKRVNIGKDMTKNPIRGIDPKS